MQFAPSERLALPGGPVSFRRQGSGPPLLLIHGWRGSSRHWQPTIDALADLRDCIALDLPGHGETPPWAASMDGETLADLALAVADRLGLERFDLAGHSFGGAVAVFLAARQPQRVGRLAVVSLGTARNALERAALEHAHGQLRPALEAARPWLALGRPWLALCQPWIDEALERAAAEPALARSLARAFVRDLPEDDRLVRDGVLEFLRADPLASLEIAVAAGSPAFRTACARVQAPTLLVAGDADPIMPIAAARALADLLPGARLVELPGCGHLPMVERAEALHAALRDFIA